MRISVVPILLVVVGVAKGCTHDASVCVSSGEEIVQYNPNCMHEPFACGVRRYECCQYCGFEDFPDCSDHEFYIDIVQGDEVNPSPGECAPELAGLIGDWLVFHAQNFFGEQEIMLEGALDVVIDESPPGTFVDLGGMARTDGEGASTPLLTTSPTATPSSQPASSPSFPPSFRPTLTPTREPTKSPTASPTTTPTTTPTKSPTSAPTSIPTPVPSLAPIYSGPRITHFELINADTGTSIRSLRDGETLYLSDLPSRLNIEAIPSPGTIVSVKFTWNGKFAKIEGLRPYSLAGDEGSEYLAMNSTVLAPGPLVIEATPYSGTYMSGIEYPSTAVSLTVDASSETAATAPAAPSAQSSRILVAQEDFDGRKKNFVSGFDSTVGGWDGGKNRVFGAGSPTDWPQSIGIPANVADSTVYDITTRGLNLYDNCGIFGQNRDMQDRFFAVSDVPANITAHWTFDVSGQNSLELSIDMGGISNYESHYDRGYSLSTRILFLVDVGGCKQTAFELDAVEDFQFSTRPMDNGNPSGGGSGGGRLLKVTGDEPVAKRLAEDGSVATNAYLDKSPPFGPGAGKLDTFTTAIGCPEGSTLTLRVIADLDREAMVFDNIKLTGVSREPSAGSTQYWNGNTRRLARRPATRTAATTPEQHRFDRNLGGRALYYSYWFRRYSYYGRMMCVFCDFDNEDFDAEQESQRRLMLHGHHSMHSDYEAYISFHLTREVTGYLSEAGVSCLGPVADLDVYFSQTS